MRPAPERMVLRWFSSQAAEDLHVTAVTMAEILYGIELISSGRRRDVASGGSRKMFGDVFADRILTFEDRAARVLLADCVRRAAGRQTYLRSRCADRGHRASPWSDAGHAQSLCVRRMRGEAGESVGGMSVSARRCHSASVILSTQLVILSASEEPVAALPAPGKMHGSFAANERRSG